MMEAFLILLFFFLSLIEETEGLAKSRKKTVLISSFLKKIEDLVENREEAR